MPVVNSPRARETTPRSARALFEACEPRRLFAVNISEGVLQVTGTTADDEIIFSRDPDNPNTLFDAHLGQSENAVWRARVDGSFTGHYDEGAKVIPFLTFKLKTNDKFSVAGRYTYTGSTGHEVEGTLQGRLIFDVDAKTKAVSARVEFGWIEPSGTGRGVWAVDATGKLKGTWGRGGADSGGGGWELAKAP